jgi:hypothetical protein
MKTTYLLPCTCGERFQVDASESGLVMKCQCGASLKVPTLRGLEQLEKVLVDEPTASPSAWGGPQRGMAIGLVLALVGLSAGVYWTWKPLPRPEDVFEQNELARLGIGDELGELISSPAGTVALWRMIEQEGLIAAPAKVVERFHRERRVIVWWRAVAYAVGGIGLLVLGVSLLAHRSRGARPRRLQTAAAHVG